ncbi:MAG: phage terminase large subunit [Sediminibacterium sp.]|nr:phage terminase large subunit [Sediminibacterium sp.]
MKTFWNEVTDHLKNSDKFIKKYSKLYDKDYDIISLNGGRNSGKSHALIQYLALNMLFLDYYRCAVFRKFAKDLKNSILQNFMDVVQEMKIDKLFKKIGNEIHCINGNTLIGCYLEGNVKGLAGVMEIIFEEELPDDETQFNTIILTARLVNTRIKTIILTNNRFKKFKNHWYYKKFYENRLLDYNFVYSYTITDSFSKTDFEYTFISIHTTCTDNIFCNPRDRALLESLKEINYFEYLTNYLGVFCDEEVQDRIIPHFQANLHYNKPFNIHDFKGKITMCSFDFNRQPYSSCLVAVKNNGVLHIVDLLKSNMVRDLIALYSDKYITKNPHNFFHRITGDVAGTFKSANTELTSWNIIQVYLFKVFKSNPQYYKFVLPSKNPSVPISSEFVNILFRDNKIVISNDLIDVYFELLYLRQNSEGLPIVDKIKGIEQNGHIFDTLRYLCVMAFNAEYNQFLRYENKANFFFINR